MAQSDAPMPARLPVRGSDLLLILILTLGGARVLLPLLAGALLPGGTAGGAGFGGIMAILAIQLGFMAAVAYAVVVHLRGTSWQQLGFVPLTPGWAGRSFVITLASLPVLVLVGWAQREFAGDGFRNPQLDVILPDSFSTAAFLATLVITAVVAPLVEETIFRGVLYRWLRERLGVPLGMGVSAGAFALLHGIPALIPGIFVLGLILAWVYERANSIWAPIIVHGTYNGLVTLTLYLALMQGVKPAAG
ncbi:hypothetical protein SAMN05216241_102106 [Limimonas halophila]|uniref:CAAX prenyl protease 2/Lysostaphin resistance protein A-like domain-containing protein n=1 Tax=Limimonas halophila TaxID=1082479 RepID=A0A1G7NBQ6_9PROT|nr:CPBP family intramembrane glutamic endopeptidase [Limimonas halophila]SDF71535.1 hypothetical protein SAMN05216241_102106 [Limimonas halophila]